MLLTNRVIMEIENCYVNKTVFFTQSKYRDNATLGHHTVGSTSYERSMTAL